MPLQRPFGYGQIKRQNRDARHSSNQAFRQAMRANPAQVASWFGQQDPTTQRNLQNPGQFGTTTASPWGNIGLGQSSNFNMALQRGGLNQNALNQMLNTNSYNPNDPTGIWDYTVGGSGYGRSSYDATGWDTVQPGITQDRQFDPNAWNGSWNGNQPGSGGGAPHAGPGVPGFGPPSPSGGSGGPTGSWDPYWKPDMVAGRTGDEPGTYGGNSWQGSGRYDYGVNPMTPTPTGTGTPYSGASGTVMPTSRPQRQKPAYFTNPNEFRQAR